MGNRVSASHWLALWLTSWTAILWPAFVNGGPFWFPDTSNYIRGADAAFVTVTGLPSDWSDRLVLPKGENGLEAHNEEKDVGLNGRHSLPRPLGGKLVITGRSIYYGSLIYLPIRFFGPWAAIIVQAALISACLVFSLAIATRDLQGRRPIWPMCIIGGLIALTPISFYTCMLMPDIWSGVTILMVALLALKSTVMRKREKAFAWIIGAASASFHSSHILLAMGVGVSALIFVSGMSGRIRGVLTGFGIGIIGIISSFIFSVAVTTVLGSPPISPPFLSARLIDSGPGLAFLDHHCRNVNEQKRFALCTVRRQLPKPSDTFLWGQVDEGGVFQVVPPDLQRRMAAEDKKFFIHTVMYDPFRYVSSVTASTLETLTSFNMINFNYHDGRRESIVQNHPINLARDTVTTKAYENTMPTESTVYSTIVVSCFAALVICFGHLSLRGYAVTRLSEGYRLALILVAGVLANAVICGALSKPDARYQMRLQWLVPLAAAFVLIGQRSQGDKSDTWENRLVSD